MPFRFKRAEPVREGFRRIALEQFNRIAGDLATPTPEHIHSARKRCKMLRALLQLFRGGIDQTILHRENARLSSLATALAPARDSAVRLQTFNALVNSKATSVSREFAAVRAFLENDATTARRQTLSPASLRRIQRQVALARTRYLRICPDGSGWRLIAPGLRRTFVRGRNAFQSALDQPSSEANHEWRKWVKVLLYHASLLAQANPSKIGRIARELDALGELLGDDHDLSVLDAYIKGLSANHEIIRAAPALSKSIACRRAELFQTAQKLGVLVYREKPRKFVDRLHEYWRSWRK